MISLLEYILESISSKELIKDIEIKKVKDNTNIVSKNTQQLGVNDIDELYLFQYSDHYQLIYKEQILGVFGLYDFKNSPQDRISRWVYQFFSEIYPDSDKFNKLSLYVTYLLMFPNASKMLDINSIATIKVFFDKLKKYSESLGKEFIIANGKDDKTTKLYAKCGGFKRYIEFYPDEYLKSVKNDDIHNIVIQTGVIFSIHNKYSELKFKNYNKFSNNKRH